MGAQGPWVRKREDRTENHGRGAAIGMGKTMIMVRKEGDRRWLSKGEEDRWARETDRPAILEGR